MLKKKQHTRHGLGLLEDWELYRRGKEYNYRIDLYDKVSRNERFYRGEQWEGVRSEGLPTPVFNLFKRIIGYYISSIMSDATAMRFSIAGPRSAQGEEAVEIVNRVVEERWEMLGIDSLLGDALLDAALSGDAVAYTYWDASARTGQPFTGDFVTKLVDNTNVFFGDPNSHEIQSQPYILIAARELVEDVRAQARRAGRSEGEIALIVPDADVHCQVGDYSAVELENTKCMTLIKLWRGENGTIMSRKTSKSAVICDTVDTRLKRYPVCYFNWTRVKGTWHGEAVGTGLIDNQVFINKAFAMVMKHMMDTAFSKVVYDSTVIDDWSNRVGEAIAVNGNVDGVAKVLQSGTMQGGMLDVIAMAIGQTKEFMGATDAALGDVDPRNTSAIIAVQQASSMPLQNIRRELYRFIEELGLIWLDYMMHYYDGLRLVPVKDGEGISWVEFNVKKFENELFSCRVDVGATGYYSEITALNTLDGLLRAGHISIGQYLERLPRNILPKKQELMEEIEKNEKETLKRKEETEGTVTDE